VSFAALTLCVASQRVFIFVLVYFVIDSVRKLLDTPSYISFMDLSERKVNVTKTFASDMIICVEINDISKLNNF
jgi:hypothetical protein